MTTIRVHDLMVLPMATIQSEAKMDDVMKAFETDRGIISTCFGRDSLLRFCLPDEAL